MDRLWSHLSSSLARIQWAMMIKNTVTTNEIELVVCVAAHLVYLLLRSFCGKDNLT